VPLILKVLEIIFFFWGKTYNRAFLGVFRGGLDLFDPKIALRYPQDSLGVKKVSGPLEKPREMPHYMFFPRKKIISRTFKISGTLIVIM
jgi:hypothetical protein